MSGTDGWLVFSLLVVCYPLALIGAYYAGKRLKEGKWR
jgi:hypothetical protein